MYRVTADDDLNGYRQFDCKTKKAALELLNKWVRQSLRQCPENQTRYTIYKY